MDMCQSLADFEMDCSVPDTDMIIPDVGKLADTLYSVMGLCKGDLDKLAVIAKQIGTFNEEKVRIVVNIIKKFATAIFGEASKSKKSVVDFIKNFNPEKLTMEGLFKYFDNDNSGTIDFNEFTELCKFMGLFLSKETRLKLFAQADKDGTNLIELDEFKGTMVMLTKTIATRALDKIGLSKEDIIWAFIFSILLLLLMFAFIFLGIFAFSTANGFNSVVNSIMPLSSGALLGNGKVEVEKYAKKLKEIAAKVLDALKK